MLPAAGRRLLGDILDPWPVALDLRGILEMSDVSTAAASSGPIIKFTAGPLAPT